MVVVATGTPADLTCAEEALVGAELDRGGDWAVSDDDDDWGKIHATNAITTPTAPATEPTIVQVSLLAKSCP